MVENTERYISHLLLHHKLPQTSQPETTNIYYLRFCGSGIWEQLSWVVHEALVKLLPWAETSSYGSTGAEGPGSRLTPGVAVKPQICTSC